MVRVFYFHELVRDIALMLLNGRVDIVVVEHSRRLYPTVERNLIPEPVKEEEPAAANVLYRCASEHGRCAWSNRPRAVNPSAVVTGYLLVLCDFREHADARRDSPGDAAVAEKTVARRTVGEQLALFAIARLYQDHGRCSALQCLHLERQLDCLFQSLYAFFDGIDGFFVKHLFWRCGRFILFRLALGLHDTFVRLFFLFLKSAVDVPRTHR